MITSFPVSWHAVISLSPLSSCLHLLAFVSSCFLVFLVIRYNFRPISRQTHCLSPPRYKLSRIQHFCPTDALLILPVCHILLSSLIYIVSKDNWSFHVAATTATLSLGPRPEWELQEERQILNNGWHKSWRYARINTVACMFMRWDGCVFKTKLVFQKKYNWCCGNGLLCVCVFVCVFRSSASSQTKTFYFWCVRFISKPTLMAKSSK